MGLFKRGKGVHPFDSETPPWQTDPARILKDFDNPAPRAVSALLESGDWRGARSMLQSLDPVTRGASYGGRVDAHEPVVATAEQWVAELPDDGVAQMVLGSLLLEWAWEARGTSRAADVPVAAWDLFTPRIQRAESAFQAAARLLPDSAEPWNHLIWTGMAAGMRLEALTRRYDEGQAREPFDPALVNSAVQMLSQKWMGSHEYMFAYARQVVAEAPAGSAAIGAIAGAHIEHLLALRDEMPIEDAAKALEGPVVGAELREAADRSIFHPDFVEDIVGLAAANEFLLPLYMGGHTADTHRVLTMLRGRYCKSPMYFFGDPGQMCRMVELINAEQMRLLR